MLNKEETTENERISRIGYIFTRIVYKLNFNLKNKSNSLLGLDILRDNTKRDLLITISLLLEKKLISLMRSGLTFSQTETLRHLYAILVCQVLEKFLFKYYGYPIKIQEKVVHKSLCSQILMEEGRKRKRKKKIIMELRMFLEFGKQYLNLSRISMRVAVSLLCFREI